MTDIVKNLINFHSTEIDHNLWDALYTVFNEEGSNQLQYQYIGEFTECMLSADIDPTDYLDYIPEGYLYGTNVTTADIREGIKQVRSYAYGGCSKLKEIYLPHSVDKLVENAFAYCNNVETLTIMNPDISIEIFAFYDTAIDTVHYNGTKKQWDNNDFTITANHIICTDGEL